MALTISVVIHASKNTQYSPAAENWKQLIAYWQHHVHFYRTRSLLTRILCCIICILALGTYVQGTQLLML